MNHEAFEKPKEIVIFEVIVKKGPVNLSDLVETVRFPSSTVHRLVQSLEKAHWVHRTIGGHGYVVSNEFYASLQQARIGVPAAAHLRTLFGQFSFRQNYHVDLYMMSGDQQCVLAESTEKQLPTGQSVSLIQDLAGLTLLAAFDRPQQVTMISSYLKTASEAEKDYVKSRAFSVLLDPDPVWGCIKGLADAKIGLPYRFPGAQHGAMVLRPRRARRVRFETFEKILEEIWVLQLHRDDLQFPLFDDDRIRAYIKGGKIRSGLRP